MKKIIIISLFVLSCCAIWVDARPSESVRLVSRTSSKTGIRRVVDASLDDLVASPEWNPLSDDIPLPVTNAVASVMAWAKSERPKIKSFRVTSIELNNCSVGSKGNIWYYIIHIAGLTSNTETNHPKLFAVVLLNGKLIPPKTEKMAK